MKLPVNTRVIYLLRSRFICDTNSAFFSARTPTTSYLTANNLHKPDPDPSTMANPRVYFDVTIGGRPSGRITMEVFRDVVPKTADNFIELCKKEKPGQGYLHCPFHRIIPGFMAQGGDCKPFKLCFYGSVDLY